jgi:hypothetical protein
MSEILNDCVIKSLITARGSLRGCLLRMPTVLESAFDTGALVASRLTFEQWFKLPQAQQVPQAPVIMYKLTDKALTVAIIDEQTQTLHSVLEGPPEELLRFVTTFVELLREDPNGRAISTPPGAAPMIKVPGGGPGDTPGTSKPREDPPSG